MDWLTEPFHYSFMRTALVASVLIGLVCASLGVYVVLRRMAFIGDALAHTALPGLVVAYLVGWSLFGGALVAGLVSATGIALLSRRGVLREDTAIGVLFTAMFAVGILLISRANSFRDLSHILFGNILGVTRSNLWAIGGVTLGVLATMALLHKELELTSFDPIQARVIGLRDGVLQYVLLVLLAVTVVVGIQAVGVVLTTALLITPAATASLVADRLTAMLALSIGVAVVSGIAGLYASYYFAVSSGAAIVLACATWFGLVWAGRTAVRALRQRRLAVS